MAFLLKLKAKFWQFTFDLSICYLTIKNDDNDSDIWQLKREGKTFYKELMDGRDKPLVDLLT